MDLSAEQFACLSDKESPITPKIVSKKPSHLKLKANNRNHHTSFGAAAAAVNTTNTATKKSSAPPNYIKILCKQKQKGITYELILEVSYYIRTSDR